MKIFRNRSKTLFKGLPDVVTDVQFPRERDWPSILSSHHVEPLQLDAEDQRRPLYLVLLGGGHLLMALLTLVHVLTLAQVLPPEVASEGSVYMISLSGGNNR